MNGLTALAPAVEGKKSNCCRSEDIATYSTRIKYNPTITVVIHSPMVPDGDMVQCISGEELQLDSKDKGKNLN